MTTPTTDEGEWAPAWGGGNEKMHLDHDRRREKRRKRRKAEIYVSFLGYCSSGMTFFC